MNTTIKKSFSISAILKRAWGLFKKHWQFLILAALAVIAIEVVLAVLIENTPGILSVLFGLASWIIQILYMIGFIYVFLSIAQDQNVGWDHFTKKAELFGKYFVGSILYSLGVIIGLALLIVPGIYFALTYGFWSYILVDKPNVGIFDSFKQSARITKNIKLKILGAAFVFAIIGVLGAIGLGIGLFVTIPLSAIATALMYVTLRDQSGLAGQSEATDDSSDIDEKSQDADYNTIDGETASDDEKTVNE